QQLGPYWGGSPPRAVNAALTKDKSKAPPTALQQLGPYRGGSAGPARAPITPVAKDKTKGPSYTPQQPNPNWGGVAGPPRPVNAALAKDKAKGPPTAPQPLGPYSGGSSGPPRAATVPLAKDRAVGSASRLATSPPALSPQASRGATTVALGGKTMIQTHAPMHAMGTKPASAVIAATSLGQAAGQSKK